MQQGLANSICPCDSQNKYKRCCRLYHLGSPAPNALALMRSRYSAYALGKSAYIIRTTHVLCPDYETDPKHWAERIDRFYRETQFEGLEIINFVDGSTAATVTFHATLLQGPYDASFTERSTFVSVGHEWQYRLGQPM